MTAALDWNATARRARAMTNEALEWSALDAADAARAADELERAGCRVSKSGGYYMDEATVYRAEIQRRREKP
jgi:hypothetical protein